MKFTVTQLMKLIQPEESMYDKPMLEDVQKPKPEVNVDPAFSTPPIEVRRPKLR